MNSAATVTMIKLFEVMYCVVVFIVVCQFTLIQNPSPTFWPTNKSDVWALASLRSRDLGHHFFHEQMFQFDGVSVYRCPTYDFEFHWWGVHRYRYLFSVTDMGSGLRAQISVLVQVHTHGFSRDFTAAPIACFGTPEMAYMILRGSVCNRMG